jgi:hypothetical protein
MNKPLTLLIALAAVTPLPVACSPAPSTAPAVKATAAATASPSAPPGCAQAKAGVAAVQHQINAGDTHAALTLISDLRDNLPPGKLQADTALAAVKMSFLNYDATSGNPVYQDDKDTQAALDAIKADCP